MFILTGVYGSHAYETTEYILYAYRLPVDKSALDVSTDETEDSNNAEQQPSVDTAYTEESSLWPLFEFFLHVLEFLIQAIL